MPPAPDEIEAAAGRIRRLAAGESGDAVYPDRTGWPHALACRADTQTLAAAWLARHPADDREPVTAAWIDAVGGDDERGCGVVAWPVGSLSKLCVGQYRGTGAWHCWVRDGHNGEETVTLPQLTTRGQLRRLLAALGVPAASPTTPTPTE